MTEMITLGVFLAGCSLGFVIGWLRSKPHSTVTVDWMEVKWRKRK